jgi:hypothetical protein
MPNRSTHIQFAAPIGGVAAVVRAARAGSSDAIFDAVVGAVGATFGGVAPDLLEPAVSPNHRSVFHGVLAGSALGLATFSSWEATCRTKCDEWQRIAATRDVGCSARSEAERNALLWRLAASFLVGVAVGYATHLLLDAGTPHGIPLVGR